MLLLDIINMFVCLLKCGPSRQSAMGVILCGHQARSVSHLVSGRAHRGRADSYREPERERERERERDKERER